MTEPMWLQYRNRPCGNVLGLETVCVCGCVCVCVCRITEELQSDKALDEKGVIVWIHFQQSREHSQERFAHANL